MAYEFVFGAIPPGLVIDHTCCNRSCVNPHHMDVVTNTENIRRGTSPLTAALAAEIREQRHVPALELAGRYGIGRSAIHHIWRGIRWAPELSQVLQ